MFVYVVWLLLWGSADGTSPLTLWFTAAGGGLPEIRAYHTHVKAAISSVVSNPAISVYPVLLLSQKTAYSIPAWLLHANRTRTLLLLYHDLTFADRMKMYGVEPHAAFFRLDVAGIMHRVRRSLSHKVHIQYDFFLYTDSDVLFTRKFRIENLPLPRVLSIGPEIVMKTMSNSGILYVNTTAFLENIPMLFMFADSHRWKFDAIDQGLILSYFVNMSTLLPDTYNWKPYWGISEDAAIVHFHAAKPGRGAECFAVAYINDDTGADCHSIYAGVNEVTRKMYNVSRVQQGSAYARYLAIYYNFLGKSLSRYRSQHYDNGA